MVAFRELAAAAGLPASPSTYDGDTPAPIRSTIRAAGQVVVTNPDMLHAAILPHHTKWFQLFEQLRVIVVDELHTYRGLFGSHVANVLRRLLRLCAHYGSPPAHRHLLGDDRQPGRAGRACCTGAPPARRRPQRRAGGRAAPPVRRPAGPRRGLGGARARRAHARPALGAPVHAGRPPDDRLRRARGTARRADPERPARGAARGAGPAHRACAATAAATCRPSGGPSSPGSATARSSAS